LASRILLSAFAFGGPETGQSVSPLAAQSPEHRNDLGQHLRSRARVRGLVPSKQGVGGGPWKRDQTGEESPRSRNFGTAPPRPKSEGALREHPREAKFVQSGPVKNARTSGPFGPVPCYATLEPPIDRKDNLLGALSFAHGTKPVDISFAFCTPRPGKVGPRGNQTPREGCIRPFCTALLQDVGHLTALRLREKAAIRDVSQPKSYGTRTRPALSHFRKIVPTEKLRPETPQPRLPSLRYWSRGNSRDDVPEVEGVECERSPS